MNKDNYATFEACKRLVDTGIVLDTEAVWRISQWGLGQKEPHSELMSKYRANDFKQADKDNKNVMAIYIPAPSMAEVWREYRKHVPDYQNRGKLWNALREEKVVDALIDLLIWVKAQKGGNDGRQDIFSRLC
jgi:hypothetical protein